MREPDTMTARHAPDTRPCKILPTVSARPRLLDLFCGAGGASVGYVRAGWEVVGVDSEPQPSYPFLQFIRDVRDMARDRMEQDWIRAEFDAIHASPPCQFATAYRRRKGVAVDAVNLIPETRSLLQAIGLPYVIENVEQAKNHLRSPVRLCGSSFGLDIRRHRLFECSAPLLTPGCDHGWQTPRFPPATNRTNLRRTVEVGSYRCAHLAPAAMGIDWMTNAEFSQAIPPAYTEFIGTQLLDAVSAR